MNLSQVKLPQNVTKSLTTQYLTFVQCHGYSTDMREIHPKEVIEWIQELSKTDNITKLCKNHRFITTFYFLLSKSKYPLALFIKIKDVKKLLSCDSVDIKKFSELFDLFLRASKQYATDPRGKNLIEKLPEVLPENKEEFGERFLTNISECFRVSTVVDFYIWSYANGTPSNILESTELLKKIADYQDVLKKTVSRGKYKKTKTFLSHVVKLLNLPQKKSEFIINKQTTNLIKNFVISKKEGIPILFNQQVISDTTWSRRTLALNENHLKSFFRKLFIVRDYSPTERNSFSPFSLTLEDYLSLQSQNMLTEKDLYLLKQFIPWLLELENVPDNYRSSLHKLYVKMPRRWKKRTKTKIGRNWLSRSDYLKLINIALETSKEKTYLRNAIYICFTGFCALRRGEAVLIQVGDFVLDKNGVIADMSGGYGKLILPPEKSKGEYSPSLDPYHIAVVPNVRNLINHYLKSDFMSGYDESTFLFRTNPVYERDPLLENVTYDHYQNSNWLEEVSSRGKDIMEQIFMRTRPLLDIKVEGTISSHDMRRSINDWIKKTPIYLPSATIERIAEIHLRHKSQGSVNEKHYTTPPSLEHYMLIIDNALNFPWDPIELEKWEDEHLVKFGEYDWGTVDGTPKYPDPRQLRGISKLDERTPAAHKQDLLQKIINASPQQNKEIQLKIQLEELEKKLSTPNIKNKFKLMAQISRIQEQLGGKNY